MESFTVTIDNNGLVSYAITVLPHNQFKVMASNKTIIIDRTGQIIHDEKIDQGKADPNITKLIAEAIKEKMNPPTFWMFWKKKVKQPYAKVGSI